MDKTIQRGIHFQWKNEKRFDFLRLNSGFILNETGFNPSKIELFINMQSPVDELFANLFQKIPLSKNGINGVWKGLYISRYFDDKIKIITDIENRITSAKIHPAFAENNKRLFIIALFRDHVIRHLICGGYFVYHASAIIFKGSNKVIVILGQSGTGKTTFALEAVKSDLFNFISEDKIVINPQNNEVYGSPTIHLREDGISKYNDCISNISLINGGIQGKKYEACIVPKYHIYSGKLHQVIILNQECVSEVSLFRRVMDTRYLRMCMQKSQKSIYLYNKKNVYEHACDKLFEAPVYELYRHNETNFQVYRRSMCYEDN